MEKTTGILDADRCVHCHLCQKHCAFLSKYQMDIGDTEKLRELSYHCFLCGVCSEVCPLGIDGRGIVLTMRRERAEKNHGKAAEKGYGFLLMEKENYMFRNGRHKKCESLLFPGCNFPSFYPETTKVMIRLLREQAGMGVLFDCCGKPVGELGLKNKEETILRRLEKSIKESGAREVVMVCPNCYDYLNGRLSVPVVSIYEKLKSLGLGTTIRGKAAFFLPCPDREKRRWLSWISPFLEEEPEILANTQCCGLGGCAGKKEPELSRAMARKIGDRGYARVYTYCASCAGNLSRNGCGEAVHVLTEILNTGEKPDTKKSLLNRAAMKFY